MKITRAIEYAIRCVLCLSQKEPGAVINRNAIASEMDIPNEFLGKIAQELAHSGFLEILQGSRGGYRLLKTPRDITLLDVIEAIGGEIPLNECVVRPDSCRRSPDCPVHQVWQDARNRLRETLRHANFAWLVERGTCMNESYCNTQPPSGTAEGISS